MDTTYLEYTAEDYIAHKLQRNGLLIAKPKFDRNGTDLIALMEINDGTKFARIQCKGRSLLNSNKSNIEIPEKYISGAFFVFLYIESNLLDQSPDLFCFTENDIRNSQLWKYNIDNKTFRLNIYLRTFKNSSKSNNLINYYYDESIIEKIKKSIIESLTPREKNLYKLIEKQKEKEKVKNNIVELNNDLHDLKNKYLELQLLESEQRNVDVEISALEKEFSDYFASLKEELSEELHLRINEYIKNSIKTEDIIIDIKEEIPKDIEIQVIRYYINYLKSEA